MTSAFARKNWFAGKSFTQHWTDRILHVWEDLLEPYRKRAVTVLEIGSWEGRSAVFFLEYLPQARITCIDTFAGGDEHQEGRFGGAVGQLERRFDANVAAYAGRVEKIRSRSFPALDALLQSGRRFDVVYVDGSHKRDDVLIDSVLAWQLLNPGGLLIWDDYLWGAQLRTDERPQPAIDAFLALHEGEYVRRYQDVQVAIEKTAPADAQAPRMIVPTRTVPRTVRNFLKFLKGAPI